MRWLSWKIIGRLFRGWWSGRFPFWRWRGSSRVEGKKLFARQVGELVEPKSVVFDVEDAVEIVSEDGVALGLMLRGHVHLWEVMVNTTVSSM